MTLKHAKTDTIPNWTQADLDAEIALGNFPFGTLLTDIVLPSDWNADHVNNFTDAIVVSNSTGSQEALVVGSGLTYNSGTKTLTAIGGGTGTVTDVSVVTANGVSGSVATSTTTPAITLTLGAITPSSVAAVGTVTGSNLSGINTGDQTSIVGISGTKAQFDTACSDGNFLYVGDSTTPNGTAGGELAGSYPNPTLTNAAVIAKVLTGFTAGAGVVAATDSILQAFQKVAGNITALVTGVSTVFGRSGAVVATSGDYNTSQVTEVTNLYFTDERAQDAVGTILTDTTTVDFTYNDAGNTITAAVIAVPVANEAADATCFPLFVTAATGDLAPKSNAGLTYNSTTNALAATTFTGALSGNATTATIATTATNVTVANEAADATCFPLFVTAATGGLPPRSNTALTYDSTTSNLASTTFTGALAGNATTATTLATGRTIAITGDLSYTSPSFNGSGNVTAAGTLATVNSNVGSFGSATQVGTFTVNGKGLITAASNTSIAITSSAVTDFTEAAQDAVGAMVDTTLVYTDGTPLLSRAALTGDVTASSGSNATTIANSIVSNAKMANMAANTIKGNNTGSPAAPIDLTVTQTTAMLNAFVGDSGSGGTKGLVPAPLTGDAGKYLKGDGTWTAVSGSGTVTDVSVVSANGFAGSVATSTTTPAITISTSITGVLKGNGTAISAAVANTDYQSPISLTTTGTSGAATFIANVLNIPQYTGGGGITTGQVVAIARGFAMN